MTDQDVTNFSSSSSHRLPTISASQALRNISSDHGSATVSTGLKKLDLILQGKIDILHDQRVPRGGLARGQVTEIYGPPGVGKTTFAMQASANALHEGDNVVWVDASFPIAGPRFKEILSSVMYPFSQNLSSSPPVVPIMDDLLGNFHHFTAPSLPHLLALLTYPLGSFPPPKTSLLVIDSVSTAFSIAYPNSGIQANRLEKQATNNKKDASQWAASRKWAVMGDFVSRMGKLAATKNLAILLTSQTTTKVRINSGAVLTPTLSGTAWENGCANRIVLFRDWIDSQEEDDHSCEMHKARFAGVLKSGGVVHDEYGGFGVIIPFAIESNGLRELLLPEVRTGPHTIPIIPNILKRKREEVGDSQSEDGDLDSDEEYGWAQEDGDATQGLVRDEIIAPD